MEVVLLSCSNASLDANSRQNTMPRSIPSDTFHSPTNRHESGLCNRLLTILFTWSTSTTSSQPHILEDIHTAKAT